MNYEATSDIEPTPSTSSQYPVEPDWWRRLLWIAIAWSIVGLGATIYQWTFTSPFTFVNRIVHWQVPPWVVGQLTQQIATIFGLLLAITACWSLDKRRTTPIFLASLLCMIGLLVVSVVFSTASLVRMPDLHIAILIWKDFAIDLLPGIFVLRGYRYRMAMPPKIRSLLFASCIVFGILYILFSFRVARVDDQVLQIELLICGAILLISAGRRNSHMMSLALWILPVITGGTVLSLVSGSLQATFLLRISDPSLLKAVVIPGLFSFLKAALVPLSAFVMTRADPAVRRVPPFVFKRG